MATYEMHHITRSWRGKCSCGFVTEWTDSRYLAEIDLRAHARVHLRVTPS